MPISQLTLYTCYSSIAMFDYTGVIQILNFTGNGSQTVTVDILDDSEREGTEYFSAQLTTTQDDLVLLQINSANIFIEDDDDRKTLKYVLLHTPVYCLPLTKVQVYFSRVVLLLGRFSITGEIVDSRMACKL